MLTGSAAVFRDAEGASILPAAYRETLLSLRGNPVRVWPAIPLVGPSRARKQEALPFPLELRPEWFQCRQHETSVLTQPVRGNAPDGEEVIEVPWDETDHFPQGAVVCDHARVVVAKLTATSSLPLTQHDKSFLLHLGQVVFAKWEHNVRVVVEERFGECWLGFTLLLLFRGSQ